MSRENKRLRCTRTTFVYLSATPFLPIHSRLLLKRQNVQ